MAETIIRCRNDRLLADIRDGTDTDIGAPRSRTEALLMDIRRDGASGGARLVVEGGTLRLAAGEEG